MSREANSWTTHVPGAAMAAASVVVAPFGPPPPPADDLPCGGPARPGQRDATAILAGMVAIQPGAVVRR